MAEGQRFALHAALGSVCNLTNGSGATTDTYLYDSFGNFRQVPGVPPPSSSNRLTYTGQYFNFGLGLYDYHARFMDPGVSRFLEEDPKFGEYAALLTLNRYVYALSNPLRFIDIDGLKSGERNPRISYEEYEDLVRNEQYMRGLRDKRENELTEIDRAVRARYVEENLWKQGDSANVRSKFLSLTQKYAESGKSDEPVTVAESNQEEQRPSLHKRTWEFLKTARGRAGQKVEDYYFRILTKWNPPGTPGQSPDEEQKEYRQQLRRRPRRSRIPSSDPR
jgi:RHS repeat-associated protein